MKFVIRKVTDQPSPSGNWFLVCGKGRRFEWASIAKATRFDDVGDAAIRAEKLGLRATDITVEAVLK